MRISKLLPLVFLFFFSESFGQAPAKKSNTSEIIIQWKDTLTGDFAFSTRWSYTDGIIRDRTKGFQCVAGCHPRLEKMLNAKGEIMSDSLNTFYSLIDTTHYYHTLNTKVVCYEFDSTQFITCIKNEAGFVNCFTNTNASNHSSLRFSIIDNKCIASVQLNSSDKTIGFKIFKLQSGALTIERTAYNQNILKANFNFIFYNSIDPKKTISWKGSILSPISEL